MAGVVDDHWEETEIVNAKKENREPRDEPYYPPFEQTMRYFLTFHCIVDLVTIIPSFIAFASSKHDRSTFVRFIRMLRVIRLVRLSPKSEMMAGLLSRTLTRSKEAIVILLFYLCIIVIVGAAVIYTVEQGTYKVNSDFPNGAYLRPDGLGGMEESPFISIPTSIYYLVVTVTTVGYGDITPTTMGGRAVATFLCILGVLVLALPISVVGSNFSKEFELHMERLKEQTEIREKKKNERRQSLIKLKNQFPILRPRHSNPLGAESSASSGSTVFRALSKRIFSTRDVKYRGVEAADLGSSTHSDYSNTHVHDDESSGLYMRFQHERTKRLPFLGNLLSTKSVSAVDDKIVNPPVDHDAALLSLVSSSKKEPKISARRTVSMSDIIRERKDTEASSGSQKSVNLYLRPQFGEFGSGLLARKLLANEIEERKCRVDTFLAMSVDVLKSFKSAELAVWLHEVCRDYKALENQRSQYLE